VDEPPRLRRRRLGEPIATGIQDEPTPPVLNLPAGQVSSHARGPVVLRVASCADVLLTGDTPPNRVLWIETSVELASSAWPTGAGLDVVLGDPQREAPLLYDLARLRHDRPLRVTIEAVPGVATASRVAIGLQFPVRLLARQPAPAVVAELATVLDLYLHDPQCKQPVEFFHSALARRVHDAQTTLWTALEHDPGVHRRVADDGRPDPTAPPHDTDFVAAHLAKLVDDGAACASCPFREPCAGWFKWPDPSYDCTAAVGLLRQVEDAAAALTRDLADAREACP
jgi:hypothetical protein